MRKLFANNVMNEKLNVNLRNQNNLIIILLFNNNKHN